MESYTHNPYSTIDFSQMGHGYRNICWVPGARNKYGQTETGHIILFGYDNNKQPKTFSFPFCPSTKYEVKHRTNELDLYNKFVETRYFDNDRERDAWVDKMDTANVKVMTSYRPEEEFLIEHFREYTVGDKLDDGFNQQPIRTHFIDIEVAIEREFPEADVAKYPINLITVYDSYEQRFISWASDTTITNTLSNELNVELRKFNNERDMLHDYLEWHVVHYPDIITGWNCREFDTIYIINRMIQVLGKNETKRYSPIGKFRTNIEQKTSDKKVCKISGISILDMFFLYRDKFKIKQALDGGYNLGNVAMVEIEDDKLHYRGSMLDFYKSNFQKFWEYNVQDVNLVVKLEEKLKLLTIARKISSIGCAQLESIYTTIGYVVSSIDIYARTMSKRVFITHIPKSKKGVAADQYEGAFVFPTYAGLYKRGIAGVDFNSLYPSTARVLNLSPETLVGMLYENTEAKEDSSQLPYYIEYVSGECQYIDQAGLDAILDKVCILARNGALFYKHEIKEGIFANWCGNFFMMRKSYKKLLAQCNEEIEEITKRYQDKPIDEKDKARIEELEVQAEYYDATQYALKILINSAYGTLGTTYSPLYDVRLAEAITLTGQFANRSTSKYLNNLFQEQYGQPPDVDITISGDTDSVTGDMLLDVILED